MTKTLKQITLLLLLLLLPTIVFADASTVVNNEEELLNALKNSEIKTIVLNKDIETTQKINITRPIYLDGNNHTIKYVGTFGKDNSKDNKVWGGIYVLQVYRTNATIKDIKLTGANAGLLINGSEITFEGTIDVSGNGFGGIELSQGSGVTETSKLSVKDGGSIVNKDETKETPTLWVPSDSKDAVVVMNGIKQIIASGKEVTLSEISELFNLTESPQTGDNVTLYFSLSLISLLSLAVVSFKTSKREL